MATKDRLKEHAIKFFDNHSSEEKCFVTADGHTFEEKNYSYAASHARDVGGGVFTFEKSEVKKPKSTVKQPKSTGKSKKKTE